MAAQDFATPVTFFAAPDQGVVVARSGTIYAPSRTHDPGGGVTGPGGIDRPLMGTRPAGKVGLVAPLGAGARCPGQRPLAT